MTVFSGEVSQSSDDAHESNTGLVSLTGTTLSTSSATFNGFRFQNVTIPQGATVSAATQLVWIVSGTTINVAINTEASDNSATYAATSHNISGRSLGSHQTTWNTSGLSTGGFATSADISGPVGDLIARPGFASGNALNLIHAVAGAGATLEAWDGNNSEASEISITYSSASLFPAPVGGAEIGMHQLGMTQAMRRNRVEGYRFVYR